MSGPTRQKIKDMYGISARPGLVSICVTVYWTMSTSTQPTTTFLAETAFYLRELCSCLKEHSEDYRLRFV